jgi:hypothetical protein
MTALLRPVTKIKCSIPASRFLDDVLKDRAIDDRQHFLGNRFGGREKSCS